MRSLDGRRTPEVWLSRRCCSWLIWTRTHRSHLPLRLILLLPASADRLAELSAPTDFRCFLYFFYFLFAKPIECFFVFLACAQECICFRVDFLRPFCLMSGWRVHLLGSRILQFSPCFENIRYQKTFLEKNYRRSVMCCRNFHSYWRFFLIFNLFFQCAKTLFLFSLSKPSKLLSSGDILKWLTWGLKLHPMFCTFAKHPWTLCETWLLKIVVPTTSKDWTNLCSSSATVP